MLQYLIILLDDTSTSFCHYDNKKETKRLIGLDTLKRGIVFAMKENLNMQFVYPDYQLPKEYNDAIETIDHTKIKPIHNVDGADVVVMDGIQMLTRDYTCLVIRTTLTELTTHKECVIKVLGTVKRLNIVLKDMSEFKEADFAQYQSILEDLSDCLVKFFMDGHDVQLNLLTDRTLLSDMNNCCAGDSNITLAPDGRFYVCPAFYYESTGGRCGGLEHGLDIRNKQLYQLDHAPLCRRCDSYQCKRCVWLNQQTTMDMNTPSHEQFVTAHLERNASRAFLQKLESRGVRISGAHRIEEIDYLDPFNVYNKWK